MLLASTGGRPTVCRARSRTSRCFSSCRSAGRTAQGLPQDTVQAILQTRDGYIWLGTQEGLVRFDGLHFTVFDRQNTPALAHNNIQALCEMRDGALWIGTNRGLVRYASGRVHAAISRPTGS